MNVCKQQETVFIQDDLNSRPRKGNSIMRYKDGKEMQRYVIYTRELLNSKYSAVPDDKLHIIWIFSVASP